MQWQLACAVKKIRDHLVESRISDEVQLAVDGPRQTKLSGPAW